MDNTAGAFKTLQSATEGALIEIGESITENEVFKGVLEKLTATVGKITKSISGMTAAEQYNKVILAGLLALVPLVITAVGALSIAFGSLTAAMGPVGIAIAGVVLAYQALKKEVTESDEVIKEALESDNFIKAQENLKQRLKEVNDQLKLRREALERATNVQAKDAQQSAVTKLEEQRINLLEALKGVQDENTESLETYRKAMADYAEEQRKAREETQKYNESFTILTSTIDRLENVQLRATDSLHRLGQKFVENQQKALDFTASTSEGLKQSIDLTGGLAFEFSQNLGNAIAGAIVNGDNFAESFVTALKAMAAQLIATIALVAVLAALLIVATGGLAGLSFKGLLSAMKIVSKTSGIGIPFLAEGGIVTGPTLAMIGEGRESEAVIPLSKLPQIAGATGGAVEVYGRISGQDILLSSEKAGRVRTRYRGF